MAFENWRRRAKERNDDNDFKPYGNRLSGGSFTCEKKIYSNTRKSNSTIHIRTYTHSNTANDTIERQRQIALGRTSKCVCESVSVWRWVNIPFQGIRFSHRAHICSTISMATEKLWPLAQVYINLYRQPCMHADTHSHFHILPAPDQGAKTKCYRTCS